MTDIDIEYRAEPTLARFHRDNSFFRGVKGPWGSGKSVACVNEIVMRCMDGDRVVGHVEDPEDPDYGAEIRNCPVCTDGVRRARWAIVRNTYGELESTTLKTWRDWYPDEICTITGGSPINGRMRLPLPDGTELDLELMFLALDRPKDVKKLKSLEVTGIWYNEASEILWENVEAGTSRPGRFPKKSRLPKDSAGRTIRQFSCVIADTNPPDDDHWWYRLAVDERPRGYGFFDQPPAVLGDGEDDPYRINPDAENLRNQPLGADYWMRMIPGKTRAWIRVNLQNEYGTTSSGKPVHPQFKEYWHVSAKPVQPMRGLPLLCGLDMGLTPACVIGQLTPSGQLRFLDELWVDEKGMGVKQFLRDVVKPHLHVFYPGMTVQAAWADPAGGDRGQGDGETPYQKAAEVGFPLTAAPVSGNRLQPRKEALDEFLTKAPDGEPGLLLAPNCNMLRKAYAGRFFYERLQVGGDARYRDLPCKNIYSHIAEAGQYLAVGVLYGYQDERQRPPRSTGGARKTSTAGY